MAQVLAHRTKYVTVVLEDIFQPQNASAVLRTCDCFGIQDVHIIENRNEFNVDPEVVMGSSKWISIHRYNQQQNNTREAIQKLKKQGYRIVATSPHKDDVNLESLDLNAGKLALVFGTELTGISDIVREEADEFMKIPMYGFTESFNISVSAAISMHHLKHRLHQSSIDWQLSEADRQQVYLQWLKQSIKKSDLLVDKFYKDIQTSI
ncbi:MAG: RNA methyltransferase [Clostridiales bacterium]|nr:RNA methyltransferase [Clostridiales bacterium]